MPLALYTATSPRFTPGGSGYVFVVYDQVSPGSAMGLMLKRFRIGMAGNGSQATTVLLSSSSSIVTGTGTAGTLNQIGGRSLSSGAMASYYGAGQFSSNWNTVEEFDMMNNQLVICDYALGDEPDMAGQAPFYCGFGISVTNYANTPMTFSMTVARV